MIRNKKMSTSESTFTHQDINSKFSVTVNENAFIVEFLYIDYLKVRQYTISHGFSEPVFNNIVQHFIRDTFECLMNSHAYEIKESDDESITIVFKYAVLKKELPIVVKLSAKAFEGNEQLLADNKKLLNEVRALSMRLDNLYFTRTYKFQSIRTVEMKDFYDRYHEFLIKHCDQYADEYKITTEKSYVDFIRNRLLDHPMFSKSYNEHMNKIKLNERKRIFNCPSYSASSYPNGCSCHNEYNSGCVHLSPTQYELYQDEKDCYMIDIRGKSDMSPVKIGDYWPYYNNLLLTFLSINGYNVWFGSGCRHAFARTHHKFYYNNGIPLKGFKLGANVSLNIPYHCYPVKIIEDIEI